MDISQYKELYFHSFPSEERRDWDDLRHKVETGVINLVEVEGGFMTVWDMGQWIYIEHFAINPRQRGKGLGSTALNALGKPVVLEIEPPDVSAQARQRAQFYRRNGFTIHTCFPYLQPSYGRGLPPVEMVLATRGIDLPLNVVAEKLKNIVYQPIVG